MRELFSTVFLMNIKVKQQRAKRFNVCPPIPTPKTLCQLLILISAKSYTNFYTTKKQKEQKAIYQQTKNIPNTISRQLSELYIYAYYIYIMNIPFQFLVLYAHQCWHSLRQTDYGTFYVHNLLNSNLQNKQEFYVIHVIVML